MSIISDIQVSPNSFFSDQSVKALTTSFVEQEFSFNSICIIIANDQAGKYIEYSFDGTEVHGRIEDTDDQPKILMLRYHKSIYLRGESGGEAYRLEAY